MSFFKKLFRCSKKNKEVENVVKETENCAQKELDDESLSLVSAAGVVETSTHKTIDETINKKIGITH